MCSTPPITNTSPWFGHDLRGRGVQRLHRRAAQAIDGLAADVMRQAREQQRVAGDVHALLQRLVHAAPDHVLDLVDVGRGVALEQCLDQLGRQHLGPDVTVHAALGAAHRSADAIDDDDIAWIETHLVLSRIRGRGQPKNFLPAAAMSRSSLGAS
jgi:hypothetical protein